MVSGMKMLATAAAFADEIWIGNYPPWRRTRSSRRSPAPCRSMPRALAVVAPAIARTRNEFDAPLAWRFDESDCMVMCDNVKVPWERVFVHGRCGLAREIYIRTPGHCYGNHQSNVRYWSKLQLIVGLASRVAIARRRPDSGGARNAGPARGPRGDLGRHDHGQIEACERWPEGFVTFNRRFMYAALNWCTEMYSSLDRHPARAVGRRRVPDAGERDGDARSRLRRNSRRIGRRRKWRARPGEAVQAGVGPRRLRIRRPASAIREILRRRDVHRPGHNFREAPWDAFHKVVDDLMASYDAPTGPPKG